MSPLLIPPATLTGILRYDWVDPTGIVRDLTRETSPLLFVSRGSKGLGSAPVELVLEKRPAARGSLLRYIQTRPVEIELPITVDETSFAALLTAVDGLRSWFRTGDERGGTPGALRITRPQDDAVRQITAYYAGGLEGDLDPGGPTSTTMVVSLTGADAGWTDIEETIESYLPADIGADLSVINTGDFDAYPIWTITGPATSIALTNTTTEKSLALTADGGLTLATGDILTIDTRPSDQRTTLAITDDEGTSFYSKVSAGSALWRLVPGQNHFTISASGTSGATTFELAWLPTYEGALR